MKEQEIQKKKFIAGAMIKVTSHPKMFKLNRMDKNGDIWKTIKQPVNGSTKVKIKCRNCSTYSKPENLIFTDPPPWKQKNTYVEYNKDIIITEDLYYLIQLNTENYCSKECMAAHKL